MNDNYGEFFVDVYVDLCDNERSRDFVGAIR